MNSAYINKIETGDTDESPLLRAPLSDTQSERVSLVFRALSDPVRLQIFSLIASHPGRETYVGNITPDVNIQQPTISHHLRTLRAAGLVTSERRASRVYYRVRPEALSTLTMLLTPPADTIGG